MREIKFECDCGYSTRNRKSWSNHTRYGCKAKKFTNEVCKYCGKMLPKRKPSEKGIYCNRDCYMAHRRIIKPKPNMKTGESRTRLYRVWIDMKRRVEKQNCKDYKNYGGRGISICTEWSKDFMSFKSWALSNGYNSNLTIERIDVNGNYCPSNCKWIPMNEQSKNRRNTKRM